MSTFLLESLCREKNTKIHMVVVNEIDQKLIFGDHQNK